MFRTESILLKTHWVLIVMDQYSRRIIGFGVQPVAVDGVALCRMFNQANAGDALPVRLSSDHDHLFQFQRRQANLRILGIEPVQSLSQLPWSLPFVERLIRSLRTEYLDRLFFWTAEDLERKVASFQNYFNAVRVHQGLGGKLRMTEPEVQWAWLPSWLITAGRPTATAWCSSRLLPDQHFAMYRYPPEATNRLVAFETAPIDA